MYFVTWYLNGLPFCRPTWLKSRVVLVANCKWIRCLHIIEGITNGFNPLTKVNKMVAEISFEFWEDVAKDPPSCLRHWMPSNYLLYPPSHKLMFANPSYDVHILHGLFALYNIYIYICNCFYILYYLVSWLCLIQFSLIYVYFQSKSNSVAVPVYFQNLSRSREGQQ